MPDKEYPISFRLQPEDYKRFKQQVKQSGLTTSAYLRFLINDLIPQPKPTPDYFVMTRELRAIGNNIHQIAVKANALHVIDADGIKKYSALLDKQISAIQDSIELPERRK